MAELRQEAISAINLMTATMDRIVREETEKHGLIILFAKYGNAELQSGKSVDDNDTLQPNIIDVTIPLQCLVKDSQLILYTTTKVIIISTKFVFLSKLFTFVKIRY